MAAKRALEGIRVLDLATPAAEIAGRVFADLGAEVIKVEPPGGCASRRTPPFAAAREDDPEGSLYWRAYGLGKKSVVLDLELEADRRRFVALARGADVLIESFTPGTLDALGLGYADLARENPALLYVSVTPYGRTGPEAKSPASDLTLAAAGGLLNMQGDRDRPPVPVGWPETSHHGAVQAAADAILALWERRRTGLGQHLDSSMQAAVIWTLLFATGFASLYGEDSPGYGEKRSEPAPQLIPGLVIPNMAKCKDGHVAMTLVLGEVGARSFGSLMRFAAEEGALDADLAERDWSTWIQQLGGGKLAPPDIVRGFAQLVAFLGTRTKAELHERSVRERWLIAPALSAADLLADRQLEARDYWVRVGDTLHPGPFAKLSKTPIRLEEPAPSLGRDQALLDAPARRPRVPDAAKRARSTLFDGLKVADFSWVGAGPLVSKDLANLGASVVHVESDKKVDPLRYIPPWKGRIPNPANGHTPANFNQSKLGLALDLAHERAREVAWKLVDWADVVIESFTPGTAEKLGIGWETLSARKPGLVMLSSCMRGQTGPERRYTAFGLQGAALAGFVGVTGWPDRMPSGPWGAYTDFIAPRFSLAALGAALHHRDETGEGQYIDLAQVEAAIHFLEPMLLDYTVNGRIAGLAGHASARARPNGVFRAEGHERYVAVSVESEEQWGALRAIVPGLASRDDAGPLADWLAAQEPFAVARRLREAGVPASVVMRAPDLHANPQLAQRGFFVELDHPRVGPALYDGPVTLFSGTPAVLRNAGPAVGQHSFEVMTGILGYDEDAVAELAAAGVLS
jgi:crotonobetainyl-CoA:carnitine CoA-transferase CaiB-like acyl-CoA transferase